jgi:hypothetical protein
LDKWLTVDNLSKVGVVTLLSIVLVTGASGYWVWGTTYTEMKVDRDRWEAIALDGLKAAKQLSSVRIPIMDSAPQKPTPENVKSQLDLIKRLNNIK